MFLYIVLININPKNIGKKRDTAQLIKDFSTSPQFVFFRAENDYLVALQTCNKLISYQQFLKHLKWFILQNIIQSYIRLLHYVFHAYIAGNCKVLFFCKLSFFKLKLLYFLSLYALAGCKVGFLTFLY